MKRGTKIGWLLVAFSLILSVWVIASQKSDASTTTSEGFVISDDGTVLEGYTGAGGAITIPDGIITINAGVFREKAITQVTMPDSVTTLGSGVFQGCSDLGAIALGSSLSSIPADTFRECMSLGSIVIPNSVTSIGSQAFYGCASLSSVTIPASVGSISTDAFMGCSNLTDISVAAGNSAYSSTEGCLYNASSTRLLLVPEGRTSLSIAAGTTTIASGALSDCIGITNVSLPGSVTTIENDAFSGSGIETITIPASVTTIGTQSNWYPSTIYGYSGSAAENFARDNGIVFEVIGTGDTDPDNGNTNNGGNNGGNTDNGGSNNNGGDVVNPDGSVTHPDGTVTHPDGSVTAADGTLISQGSGGSHTKDTTPTTADGIDPRYFLCIAIFAGGVAVLLYSRSNKMKYLSENKRNK